MAPLLVASQRTVMVGALVPKAICGRKYRKSDVPRKHGLQLIHPTFEVASCETVWREHMHDAAPAGQAVAVDTAE